MAPQSARSIVVGLGRTGLSCARYLHARHESFAVTDSRAAPPESAALQQLAPEAEVRFGAFDEALLDDAMRVIASPGVSLREPFMMSAAIRGVPIIGDIELFAREAQAPVAAITGTNGKSTVTTLVARMAEAAGKRVLAGGNLGRPALDLLEEPAPELYVLELSSFQLETTRSLRTAAAAVLNVTPDHMDRYESVGEYASAKARIFQHCDAAVINLDDPLVHAMTHRAPRVLTFTLRADRGGDYYALRVGDDVALMHDGRQLLAMSEMKIAGLHNVANALAALAMCDALQLPQEPCVQALREFPGLPHRSQWIADVRGVRYVNDSKGTPGSLVLIAGGQGKGQDFMPLAAAFRGKVRHVVLLGQDAKLLAAALEGVAGIEFAKDMDDAVQRASRVARSGETVLLSPACASLDMFRDYSHRGHMFTASVRRLDA
jgi:UDP-N-acetylmuramoylalanine--D-glutamate ligase